MMPMTLPVRSMTGVGVVGVFPLTARGGLLVSPCLHG
jgi:hypothetical protein